MKGIGRTNIASWDTLRYSFPFAGFSFCNVMSFAALHAARQSKDHKSYVNAPNGTANPATNLPASEASVHQQDDIVASLQDLHTSLSKKLDVRNSPTSGRGIHVKDTFKPGAFAIFFV
jgi:hypothetical protein